MRTHVLVPVLALAAVLLSARMALPAEDEHTGWYLEVGAASATPGNVNTPLLVSQAPPFGAGPFENETLFSDLDSSVDYRVGFGYSWGRKGRLQVTYWSYSDDESSSSFVPAYGGSGYNVNWFTIGPVTSWGSGYYGSFYYDTTVDMKQEIKASTLDIEYKRPMASNDENLKIEWGIGIRIASFEDKVRGNYFIDYSGGYNFPVSREVESDGVGLTGSIGVKYLFPNDVIGITSNLRVGFLTSDVDASHSAMDQDGYYAVAGAVSRESSEVEDEVANTVDFDAGLLFRAGDRVEFDVGWFFSTWSDLAQVALTHSNFGSFQQAPALGDDNRDRISWSGPQARVRFRF